MKVANRYIIVSTKDDTIVSRHKSIIAAENALIKLIKLLEVGESEAWTVDKGETFLIAEVTAYGTTEACIKPID